ncbi:MAG TPA: hypothetical protein VLI41_13180 [Phenylobacterium sp.]|uniref:hypothetical protein n=1 Tax=Phenylobacterium sp. TaxID=1871053 RepID=UPI002BF1F39B|nr:hypothetical protein [Phenylobacterium sp.]HSV04147.1 hypothetical protein [Phenylobacterium sp.]
MADDASFGGARAWPFAPRLDQALRARASVWASCACGRQAAIDPAPWLGQGLARQRLGELETRLRCLCGSRRARLEVRGLSEAPPGASGGIYIFR